MKKNHNKTAIHTNRGLVKSLVIIIAVIIILAYFNVDLRAVIDAEAVGNFFEWVGKVVSTVLGWFGW